MLVLLAVDNDTGLPRPHVLEVLLVLGLGGVELGELVALIVGSDIEGGEILLASDDESTLDDGVVVLSVDGSTTEDVLAGAFKTGEEAANQVVGHEGEGELIVVLVVDTPDGVLLEVEVVPEILEGIGGLAVGVLSLVLIKGERSTGEELKRVLGLGSLSRLIGGLSGGLSGGLRSGLGRLLLGLLGLLGGSVGQSGSVQEADLLSDSGEDGLAGDGLEPTGDVGVLLSPVLAVEVLEATGDDTGGEEISEGDALADEVGVAQEVLLNNLDSLSGGLGGVIDVLLVVGGVSEEGAVPRGQGAEDLLVEEGEPLQDGSVVLLSLAKESGLLVLGGN